MSVDNTCRILTGCTLAIGLLMATAAAQPRTVSKEKVKGDATVTTEQKKGTVLHVEGDQLVVKMSTGEIKSVTVPPDVRFIIDDKSRTVGQLKPGTTLSATYTTTTTPVTERTTRVAEGTVWFRSGTTVILTHSNGENRQYKIKESDPIQFTINGRPASVFDLRKGMTVSAVQITEEPSVEITTGRVIRGSAPAPKPRQVAAKAPAPAPPAPRAPAARPAAAPAPRTEPAPVQLPKTGSPLALIGMLGLLCAGASLGIRAWGVDSRRS